MQMSNDESFDNSDFISLRDIRSLKTVQKIDWLITNIDSSHIPQSNDQTQKLKSKRGDL